MLKLCKRFSALAVVLLLVFSAAGTAFAAVETGSVTVKMHDSKGKPITGGKLRLYTVATPGEGRYELSPDFKGCTLLPTDDLGSQALAQRFAARVTDDIHSLAKIVDKDGIALFDKLEKGLYLVVQSESAEGYLPINPFLVTIPCDGEMDVDATPKAEAAKPGKPNKPNKPGNPDSPGSPGKPGNSGKQPLIQTGQLNWPVPVLSAIGLVLIALGWVLLHSSKRENYEA